MDQNWQSEALELRNLARMARRQLLPSGLIVLLFLGGGLLFLAGSTPSFTASAMLEYDPEGDIPGSRDRLVTELGTHVALLSSAPVVEAVIAGLGLDSEAEFAPRTPAPDRAVAWLRGALFGRPDQGPGPAVPAGGAGMVAGKVRDRLHVGRLEETRLIRVSFTSESADLAAAAANRFATGYLGFLADADQARRAEQRAAAEELVARLRAAAVGLQQQIGSLGPDTPARDAQTTARLALARIELGVNQGLLRAALASLNQAEAPVTGGDLRIVAEARVPARPSWPRSAPILALFGVMGAVLAALRAGVLEWRRRPPPAPQGQGRRR